VIGHHDHLLRIGQIDMACLADSGQRTL
jgi:hypothetical protein